MKRLICLVAVVLLVGESVYAGKILTGVRVSYNLTQEQIRFVNEHFDFVMTPFLSHEVRNAIQKPKLLLYRSIQGTWTDFDQFDWQHINSHENMFCHSDSANQSPDTRILTRWNSWLMDGNDLVDSTAADALNHWVNYYAVTASEQVHAFDYDGLFIDSAGHRLGRGAVYGVMPWDYSPDTWRDGRYAALRFIKAYLPDKTVIFNGLHSDNGADSSLSLTDGGMWEDFAFSADDGSYKGEEKWWEAIRCLDSNKDRARLVLVVKKPGLMTDLQARIFSVASYLLVCNENVVLSLSDYAHNTSLQYYPEYEISLGDPLGDFSVNGDSLCVRAFENGLVAVNASSSVTRTLDLGGQTWFKVVPTGGGFVDASGDWDGSLSYEEVSGNVAIPPVSALILRHDLATDVAEPHAPLPDFELEQNFPNPFNPSTTIRYRLSKPGHVVLNVYDSAGRKVRTLVDQRQRAGSYSVEFTGPDLPTGTYYCTLRTGAIQSTRKMLLLK